MPGSAPSACLGTFNLLHFVSHRLSLGRRSRFLRSFGMYLFFQCLRCLQAINVRPEFDYLPEQVGRFAFPITHRFCAVGMARREL